MSEMGMFQQLSEDSLRCYYDLGIDYGLSLNTVPRKRPFTCLFSLDVLRLAAASLAPGAYHLLASPRCSVCSHVRARVDAISL